MLERSVACLEPCGLRALQPHKQALRPTRQLHTAFWQHGAADIELTAAWRALMHGPTAHSMTASSSTATRATTKKRRHGTMDHSAMSMGTGTGTGTGVNTGTVTDADADMVMSMGTISLDPARRDPPLNASAFVLDFLYPAGAVSLMRRRLSPLSPRRHDRLRLRTRPSHVSPRLYNSSLPQKQPDSPSAPSQRPAVENSHTHTTDSGQGEYGLGGKDPGEATSEANTVSPQDHALHEPVRPPNSRQTVSSLSSTATGLPPVSSRIFEMLRGSHVSDWSHDMFVSAVFAGLSRATFPEALSVFERGLQVRTLDNTALIEALDLVLAFALQFPTTEFLNDIWKLYPEMTARLDFNMIAEHLRNSASVSGLAEKVLVFQNHIAERLSDPSSDETSREALQALQKLLVRLALVSCEEPHVIPLLLLSKDFFAFEDCLRGAREMNRGNIIQDVYVMYRELPGSSPSHAALHIAFGAYTRADTPVGNMLAGVKLLWDDWHRFHGVPSRRAYQKHLGFHAAQGNKERVYSLWSEYVKRFRDDPEAGIFNAKEGSKTFAHLLQVNAVNAEPEETQRIFDDMTDKFKVQPATYAWNILLNAYAKADDYDGAIATFDRLCEACGPDTYSYGTLMQMAGSRGDLGFAVDLYRRARSTGVIINDAILSSLVDAYCQNDLLKEAQDVCTRAAIKGVDTTRMWNKLLYYHALRRDLASINKILTVMADKDVAYNQFTYQQLLLGLALCRQSQHALHLLTVALKDNVFQVTQTHFQIVMGALLRTGEPALVRRLSLLMKEYNLPVTEEVLFRISQALGQWHNMPPAQRERRSGEQWIGGALRIFFRIYGHKAGRETEPKTRQTSRPVEPRELLRSGREVYQFGTMMQIFAQLNNSVQVDELVQLYRHVFQDTSNHDGLLPISMLTAVIRSSHHDQQHDRVVATWELLFKQAKMAARSVGSGGQPQPNIISPKYRYVLSGGLRVMQEMLFQAGDAGGLLDLVRVVRKAGFEIDSKNWNYHVQVLVQMKRYKEAFTICEEVLMPNWTGWYMVRAKQAMRNALPLDTRRQGSSPRHLRPTATTLYRLARAYLELDRSGPWSKEDAATLCDIESDCAQVMRAIKSMARVRSPLEDEIFGPSTFPYAVEASGPAEDKDEFAPA
ncbi:hypothetical protein F4777DRAFT_560897 [Nemania sp. FL0916]|nr:hypothetical protein F4777DRAFT_560897 [Nemania sp. FL0916]